MERMESSIFTLQQENDRLKREMAELKEKQENIQTAGKVVNIRAEKAERRSNFNEQYSRNYNLRIYFVKEPERETAQQCQEAVLKLFHEKLGLRHIKERDLDAVHRLGRKTTSATNPRAIIVRFISRKTREEVISSRRKLKKKVGQTERAAVIVEDLTKDNYILFQRARLADTTDQCWTRMGKIFVKTKSGQVKQITRLADINATSQSQNLQEAAQMSKGKAARPGDQRQNSVKRYGSMEVAGRGSKPSRSGVSGGRSSGTFSGRGSGRGTKPQNGAWQRTHTVFSDSECELVSQFDSENDDTSVWN